MGKVRIIGGIYRRRQLLVLDSDGLRPTLDRVKETAFNWLGQDLTGLRCLDLFAGSGSLGFEALSRNAREVILIEKDPKIANQLRSNLSLLKTVNASVYQQDALSYLLKCDLKFDVIFLDPPYGSDLLCKSLPLIAEHLAINGRVYIEALDFANLKPFQLLKEGKAGSVKYALLGLGDWNKDVIVNVD